jgi:hypothetical protein
MSPTSCWGNRTRKQKLFITAASRSDTSSANLEHLLHLQNAFKKKESEVGEKKKVRWIFKPC